MLTALELQCLLRKASERYEEPMFPLFNMAVKLSNIWLPYVCFNLFTLYLYNWRLKSEFIFRRDNIDTAIV